MKTKRGHHVTKRRTKPRAQDMREGGKRLRFIPSSIAKKFQSFADNMISLTPEEQRMIDEYFQSLF